jgi:hypothetical protein
MTSNSSLVPNMKYALLIPLLLATPALADTADLLASPATQLQGALLVCATGAQDPEAADALFTGAGWAKEPDDEMGVTYYTASDGTQAMMWPEPGFCMIDAGVSTDAMVQTLTSLLPAKEGKDSDGCRAFTLDSGVVANLSGPGQDPVCEDPAAATLRFVLPQ